MRFTRVFLFIPLLLALTATSLDAADGLVVQHAL